MLVRLFSAVLFFFLFVAGCSRPAEQQAQVSGKVTYQGKPLPGGKITFVSLQGYAGSSPISPQGEYHLKAPIGEVRIGVDNRMLKKDSSVSSTKAKAHLKKMLSKKSPGKSVEGQDPNQGILGTYVHIPALYVDPSISGLTYTVSPGSQTHDIELTDNPSVAPGS